MAKLIDTFQLGNVSIIPDEIFQGTTRGMGCQFSETFLQMFVRIFVFIFRIFYE